MSTLIENVNRIQQAKSDIISSIESKGIEIPDNTKIDDLPDYIDSIDELKGETRTVSPSTSQQVITPSSDKNAITQVTVNAVTSSIDANIVPNNIKKDVSILGVTGAYEGNNFLIAKDATYMGSHDGTRVSNTVYKNVTTVSWNPGDLTDIDILDATLSDGQEIHTSGSSYSINLNGRTIVIWNYAEYYYGCLLRGTKITLADKSEKNIEDIDYNDELLVWDFDNACLTTAKPIWIKKTQTIDYWFLNKYKSGKILKTTGKSETGWGHRTFDLNKNKFIYTTESVSDNIFTLDEIDTHMSCERIEEPCEFYNIITERHFNLFANRILTSCSLNNLYPIKCMKYIKDNRKLRKFEDYSGITQEYFNGLRLSENNSNIEKLNSYVSNLFNIRRV